MAEVNRLEWDAYIRDSELLNSISRIERRVNDMAVKVTEKGRSIEDVFSNMAKAATAFLTINTAQNFIQELIKVRSEFQQLDIAFTTMLGSKERADKLTKDLIEFAGTTPFGMKDTANAAKQLLAYGSSAESVKDELRMLGDVAAGTSQPIGDLVYLYGTLRTQGKAYLMDIRQFAGRGIPIYAELAKVLKINESQVNDFVSAGKVGFAEIQKAFQNMTATGSLFGGLMEAQSKTIQGELERLGDAYDQMLNNIGKDSEGMISIVISGLSTLVENYDNVLAILAGLVTTYGVYKAALIATAAWESSLTLITTARRVAALALGTSVASLTAVEVLHYTALIIAEKAQRLLSATMLANPYIAVGAVVAGLIVTMYSLRDSLTSSEKAQNNFTEGNRKAIESMEDMKNKASELITVIRDKSATEFQTNKAYENLQKIYPNLLGNMSKEVFLKTESTKLQKDLNNENDKSGLANLSNRYEEAKNKVASLNKEMEVLKVAMRYDGTGSAGMAYGKLSEQLKTSKTEAVLLGNELKKQQQEYAYSLMNDDQKLKFLQAQKAEIENQRDAIIRVNPQINDQNAIFGKIQGKTVTIANNLNSWRLIGLNNDLNQILPKIQSLIDANKKDPNDGIRSEDWINARIKKLREDNSPLSIYSSEYKQNLAELKKLEDELAKAQGKNSANVNRQATQVYNEQERYLAILKDVEKTKAEFNTSQLSRDNQEIEGVKAKYKVLIDEIDKFNRNPKNKKKISSDQINELNDVRDNEIKETNTKIDTKYIVDNLNQQKALYDQFEAYKLQVGEEKAKERFQNELDLSKTFGQLAEKERYDLLETDPTAMTAAQKERLDALDKIIAEHDKNVKDRELAKYAEAYNAAKTHTQNLEDIEKEYQQNIKALGEKVSAEELANLKKLRDEKIKGENEELFLKSDLYKKAAKEALIRTRQEIKDQIKAVEELLKTDLAPNIKDRLQKELQGLKINLSIGSVKTNIANLEKQRQDISNALSGYNTLNGISSITDQALDAHPELKKLYDQLNQVTDQIIKLKKETNDGSGGGFLGFLKKLEGNKALQEVSDWGNVAAQSFSEMSQALGGSETQAGYLLGTIGELAGAAADVAGAIASGDPKAIVKSVVGAVGSIISISRRTKEMNRQAREENKKFYDEAMKGERDYQALLRQRERESASRGKNSYNAIIAQLEAIKKQSPELQKAYDQVFSSLQGQDFIDGKGYQHGTWFRKAKTWDVMASLGGSDYNELEKLYSQGKLKDKAKEDFEALKALKEELEEAGLSVDDLQKSLNELLTGTSVSGLASGLADLFANGKRSAQDFGDSFESIMQNAIKSSFQAKFMEDAMQPFYEELAVMMEGGNLTGDQIQKLKDKYINLGEEYAKKWEDIEKVTGVDLSGKNSGSSISGKIGEAITEKTGSLLTGQINLQTETLKQMFSESKNQGLTLSQQLDIANSSLAALNAIQSNTANTVLRLDDAVAELKIINKNTSSKGRTTEGMGL